MSLRVIAGEFRGRPLRALAGQATRPLLGRVREALFSILGARVEDALVWDLFAGTGATGIEALSRGAREVLFVERKAPALAVLRANLEQLGLRATERAVVCRGDAWRRPDSAAAPDIVFLDPPYADVARDPVGAVERVVALAGALAPAGVLCFHFMAGDLDRSDLPADLGVDLRRWGTSCVAFVDATG